MEWAVPWPAVRPVANAGVRALCREPYPGHRKGCPNWRKRPTCPPQAPLLAETIDLGKPVYCIFNAFDLAGHVERMRAQHSEWSMRQLRCCLYWQRTARKALRQKVERFLSSHQGLIPLYCPEATGVDVTATMAAIGVQLEWPPVSVAYQVALVGTPKDFPKA